MKKGASCRADGAARTVRKAQEGVMAALLAAL